MPKPIRCRRVCAEPAFRSFHPGCDKKATPVTLFVEEYETIRLVDFEKQTHEQCAQQMQISRTTVTEVYEKARFKIADAIVNGKPLLIQGGNYEVCRGSNQDCPRKCRYKCIAQSNQVSNSIGEEKMKIAIPVKNDVIYQHFGMASQFKVYTIENNRVAHTETLISEGRGHGTKLDLLLSNGIHCVICGGIGEGAITGINRAGIELIVGVSGTADEAVTAYLAGGLQSNLELASSKSQHQGHNDHDHCGHGHCSEDHCSCHGENKSHRCHCDKS